MLLGAAVGCASSPARPVPKEVSLLDAAERALGGPEALASLRGFHSKTKGTWYGSGGEVSYAGEWWFRLPLAFRWRLESDGGSSEGAIDGETGWMRSGGEAPVDLDASRIRDGQQQAVENAILLVRPLRSKDFTVTYAGPGTAAGRPTEKLRVTFRGAITRIVHIDPATSLIIKTEGRATHADLGEGECELTFDRWADQGGLKFPLHTIGLWNGEKYFEDDCISVEWRQAPEESVFRKPSASGG